MCCVYGRKNQLPHYEMHLIVFRLLNIDLCYVPIKQYQRWATANRYIAQALLPAYGWAVSYIRYTTMPTANSTSH